MIWNYDQARRRRRRGRGGKGGLSLTLSNGGRKWEWQVAKQSKGKVYNDMVDKTTSTPRQPPFFHLTLTLTLALLTTVTFLPLIHQSCRVEIINPFLSSVLVRCGRVEWNGGWGSKWRWRRQSFENSASETEKRSYTSIHFWRFSAVKFRKGTKRLRNNYTCTPLLRHFKTRSKQRE